jgi:nucleoside-specific outer membrane channel protein Tsx
MGHGAAGNYNDPMKRLLLALAVLAATSASAKIDFVEDDYATAMARAKTKNVPVFVEAWAPW